MIMQASIACYCILFWTSNNFILVHRCYNRKNGYSLSLVLFETLYSLYDTISCHWGILKAHPFFVWYASETWISERLILQEHLLIFRKINFLLALFGSWNPQWTSIYSYYSSFQNLITTMWRTYNHHESNRSLLFRSQQSSSMFPIKQ